MDNKQTDRLQVFVSLLCLFGFFVISLLIFSLAARFLIIELIGIDVLTDNVSNLDNNKYPSLRYSLLIFQAISTGIGGFLLPVFLWLWLVEKQNIFNSKKVALDFFSPKIAFLVFLLVLAFMPLNSVFIYMNSLVQLPDSLNGIENTMKDLEDAAELTTVFLTDFDSFPQFLFGFFVISLLTGVGEELFFRRGIQKKLSDSGYNHHFAIWMAAIVFSFVHFQFYGFFPRLVLGAAFGYIYFWTGNLIYPIIAHITNNGFTLILIYLFKLKGEKLDFGDKEMAELHWVLLSAIASVVLTYLIWKFGVELKKRINEN